MGPRLAISVDWGSGITNAWTSVTRIIPKLIAFAVIMFVGWLICKAIAKVLDAVLRKIGVERMAEKAGAGRFLSGSKWDTTAILVKVVYYGLLLVFLQLALGVFGDNPISTMIHSVVAWIPKAIVALVIVVVAMWLANVAKEFVSNILSAASYGKALGWVAWGFIAFFGAIAALAQIGVATFVLGPILNAVLFSLAGIAIVGIGGGLIQPMRSRWERMLTKAEQETTRVSGSVQQNALAYQKGRSDAQAGQPVTDTQRSGPYGGEAGAGTSA
ncbi:hypothetical protein KGQ20_19120 [Catenulispora sp. NF23]|uniref:Uncharacterized protein n=1 Tax=Catenulispora pinistramenti TaxID=2705254 RepID=A0ABS5L5F4_9ACTN|nr:hypothetical protein [Catenulispora pinistramenti]MBS2534886.1 hypothetical protein [Catenulispora pinistramenti]MBS2553576.1 hypothetical protein [Catenulispora pinistramenti]